MPLPTRLLLDTNVWIDNFDGTRPGSASSRRLINTCLHKGIDLLFSASSARDVYYIITSRLKSLERSSHGAVSEQKALAISAYATACVTNMDDYATAVGLDGADIWIAQRYQRIHSDFEDCLLMAAAERASVDALVTNDEKLLCHSVVAALSVHDALALIDPEIP